MFRLKRIFLVVVYFLSSSAVAQEGDVFGKWKTIDDYTGDARAVVETYERDGRLFGKVIKFFPGEGESLDPVCEACEGENKNKKILGMVIINGLVKNGREWADGEILDPDTGKIYDCKLWFEKGKLSVRGYISFFYRTQTWLPLSKE